MERWEVNNYMAWLGRKTNAQVQGFLKDGRFYIQAVREFVYVKPQQIQVWDMSKEPSPFGTLPETERFEAKIQISVDYYVPRENTVGFISQSLHDQFQRWIDTKHPFR